jgi:hypothetical protein
VKYVLSTLGVVTGTLPVMKFRPMQARVFLPLLVVLSCRGSDDNAGDSGRTLPPVYSLGPGSNTNWDVNAGPVMLLSLGDGSDSVAIVLPEATDSTIGGLQNTTPTVSGLVFELFGRGGKIASSVITPFPLASDSARECNAWPSAKLSSTHGGWTVGFVRGNVRAIPVDSIEALPSADSASLAALIAQSAATLPVSSDPVFSRLPFRVRSAYRFVVDSEQVVVADVVRTLNEEANPRIEHLFLIAERLVGATGKYAVGYYSRVAGAEETTQVSEPLSVVAIGSSKKPAIVMNVESDDGTRLGLIERTGPGKWRATWTSANIDCQ